MKQQNEGKRLVERLMGAPAPVAPPRPVIRPKTLPVRPVPTPMPAPMPRRPDPWRRRTGEEERPSARGIRAEAEELLHKLMP